MEFSEKVLKRRRKSQRITGQVLRGTTWSNVEGDFCKSDGPIIPKRNPVEPDKELVNKRSSRISFLEQIKQTMLSGNILEQIYYIFVRNFNALKKSLKNVCYYDMKTIEIK